MAAHTVMDKNVQDNASCVGRVGRITKVTGDTIEVLCLRLLWGC